MKKLFALLLAVTMGMAVLAGCGSSGTDTPSDADPAVASTEAAAASEDSDYFTIAYLGSLLGYEEKGYPFLLR